MKKPVKTTLISVVGVVMALILTVVGYVGYVVLSYGRVDDNFVPDINSPSETVVDAASTFKAATYNIGFGAYNRDFSFFMDSGTMKDGTAVSGKYAKARSKEIVTVNTAGAIAAAKAIAADFYFYQEVDVKATRSRGVNQLEEICNAFDGFSSVFAENYDSAYLFYPFNDPIGKSKSGILTLSKYKIQSALRRSLPLAGGFSKFFDLDRCILITRLPMSSGKELVLINVHLSAYDEGGIVRREQFALLTEIMDVERDAGNYVVMGGDFNHDIAESDGIFPAEQLKPEWVFALSADDLPSGYTFAAATNAPTCRSTDLPYQKGINYSVVIDGFIVSDNITVIDIHNVDLDFENSDHNPAVLEFSFA